MIFDYVCSSNALLEVYSFILKLYFNKSLSFKIYSFYRCINVITFSCYFKHCFALCNLTLYYVVI